VSPPTDPSPDSLCFFITPVGPAGSDTYANADIVSDALVEPAANDLDLAMVRADRIAAPGEITQRILDHLQRDRAAVADLTGLNANVFYEFAIRHALQLPVVLIAQEGQRLPFDVAPQWTLFYKLDGHARQQTAKRELREAIEASLTAPTSPLQINAPFSVARDQSDYDTDVTRLLGGQTYSRVDVIHHSGTMARVILEQLCDCDPKQGSTTRILLKHPNSEPSRYLGERVTTNVKYLKNHVYRKYDPEQIQIRYYETEATLRGVKASSDSRGFISVGWFTPEIDTSDPENRLVGHSNPMVTAQLKSPSGVNLARMFDGLFAKLWKNSIPAVD
jgi:hypothetical protein